jgi:hypothetical protein
MNVRRLAALLTAAAMLHVSAAAGHAACVHGTNGHHAPTSHGDAVAGSAMEAEGHAMAMHPAAEAAVGPQAVQAEAPLCETPAQQHCCDAVVGCGIGGAIAGDRAILMARVLATTRIADSLDDAPASFAPALDPPPPKG